MGIKAAYAIDSMLNSAKLWLVLDAKAAHPRSLLEVSRQAVDGGVDVIVFRHKHRPATEVYELAKPIRKLCERSKVLFVQHEYPELLPSLQPDALHLSGATAAQTNLERLLQSGLRLGVSTHSPTEAISYLQTGCSYVLIGPIYRTASKLPFGRPLGPAALKQVSRDCADKVVLIGGINHQRAKRLAGLGWRRQAFVSAILTATDPRRSAMELAMTLKSISA